MSSGPARKTMFSRPPTLTTMMSTRTGMTSLRVPSLNAVTHCLARIVSAQRSLSAPLPIAGACLTPRIVPAQRRRAKTTAPWRISLSPKRRRGDPNKRDRRGRTAQAAKGWSEDSRDVRVAAGGRNHRVHEVVAVVMVPAVRHSRVGAFVSRDTLLQGGAAHSDRGAPADSIGLECACRIWQKSFSSDPPTIHRDVPRSVGPHLVHNITGVDHLVRSNVHRFTRTDSDGRVPGVVSLSNDGGLRLVCRIRGGADNGAGDGSHVRRENAGNGNADDDGREDPADFPFVLPVELEDPLEQPPEEAEKVPARIDEVVGVVEDVAVAVERLRVGRRRNKGVGANEPGEACVVVPAAVIVEASLRIELFARKAVRRVGVALRARHLAPGVVFHELHACARLIGDDVDSADMVVVIEEDGASRFLRDPTEVLRDDAGGIDLVPREGIACDSG